MVSPLVPEQRQLLPEEQVLGRERAARPEAGGEKAAKVEPHDGGSAHAVPQSGEENQWCGHERSGSHVTQTFHDAPHRLEQILRSTAEVPPIGRIGALGGHCAGSSSTGFVVKTFGSPEPAINHLPCEKVAKCESQVNSAPHGAGWIAPASHPGVKPDARRVLHGEKHSVTIADCTG